MLFSPMCKLKPMFNIINGREGPPNERGKYVLSGPPPSIPKIALQITKLHFKKFVQLK